MSVPKKNTTWGEVLYKGKTYGILNGFHLSEEIWKRYKQYNGDKKCIQSTAPWETMKIKWVIEGDKLYLTQLCTDGLLTELMGTEKIAAKWINELELLVEDKKICKSYERRGSFINEIKYIVLKFDRGVISNVEKRSELYRSIALRNYIDRYPSYASLQIDATDLFYYLEEGTTPKEDQFFPMVTDHISQMVQKGSEEDISLDIEDVKAVLKNADTALFGAAKGSNTAEMVSSLADSMTGGILKAKSCLVHLTVNKNYPMENIATIMKSFEEKFGFDEEDEAEKYVSKMGVFIFGTRVVKVMDDGEVWMRVIVCV